MQKNWVSSCLALVCWVAFSLILQGCRTPTYVYKCQIVPVASLGTDDEHAWRLKQYFRLTKILSEQGFVGLENEGPDFTRIALQARWVRRQTGEPTIYAILSHPLSGETELVFSCIHPNDKSRHKGAGNLSALSFNLMETIAKRVSQKLINESIEQTDAPDKK